MATRRRNTYNSGESSNGQGAGLIKGILGLIGGGAASPVLKSTPSTTSSISPTTSVNGTDFASPPQDMGNAPLAKSPDRFVAPYNWANAFRGDPNLAAQWNAQMDMNRIAGENATNQTIDQTRRLLPIQHWEQQYQDLEKGLRAMPSNPQAGLIDSAINNPNIQQVNGSSFIPGTTTLDPAVAAQARQEPMLPGFAANRASVSGSNLATAENQAKILGAKDVIGSQQEAERSKNLLSTDLNNQNIAINAQNRPLTMQTAGVQAKSGLAGAQGELGVAGQLPQAKLAQTQAQTGLLQSQGNYLEGLKSELTRAQTAEATQRAKSPAQNATEMINAFTNPITSPGMNIAPIPITAATPGVHYIKNPDGSATTKVPILGPDGKTILPPGTVFPAKKK